MGVSVVRVAACAAGKDVYVEKPCSHNIFEAKQVVAAARKYNRLVEAAPKPAAPTPGK